MTNKELIEKIIDKVKKNGYDVELGGSGDVVKIFNGKESTDEMPTILEFIFSHKFAELFFGKEWEDGDIISMPMSEILEQENIKKWQHHLRQMVLKKKPLLYLKKFL